MNKSIAIVGGGMLGMTLAPRLQQKGRQVCILKRHQSLAGWPGGLEIGGYTFKSRYRGLRKDPCRICFANPDFELLQRVFAKDPNLPENVFVGNYAQIPDSTMKVNELDGPTGKPRSLKPLLVSLLRHALIEHGSPGVKPYEHFLSA